MSKIVCDRGEREKRAFLWKRNKYSTKASCQKTRTRNFDTIVAEEYERVREEKEGSDLSCGNKYFTNARRRVKKTRTRRRKKDEI
jgi:hypothetical protein